MTRVLLSSAAGLIAGTVPTMGRSSALRTSASAIVDAVLQAMTIRRGS
jgi:glutamine synthetase adenylyltransferase